MENQNTPKEKEILEKAKKGAHTKRMRPRYPRFLTPILIILLAAAVVFVPLCTEFGSELAATVFNAFSKEKTDSLNIESLKTSNISEVGFNKEIEILEDKNGINGVLLTADEDYKVTADLANTISSIFKQVKKSGFNSVFFNLNYKDGYLTDVGGKKNTFNNGNALSFATAAAKDTELRLFVVVDIKEFNVFDNKSRTDLEEFLVNIKEVKNVSGIMLKGLDAKNHGLTYNDYLKLGFKDGFDALITELLESNLKALSGNFKAKTDNAYLGIFAKADYDAKDGVIIPYNNINANSLLDLNAFDSVLSYGFGAIESTSHPFENMAKSLSNTASSAKSRLGIMLYSSKIKKEYQNPDQLTRQLMVVNEIGNGMIVFDSYKSLKEDTSGAASAALKYMQGELNDYKPKGLTFTKPSNLATTTNYSSIAIAGASDPEFPLLLDGKEVERTEGGFFSLQKDLKVGKNTFIFEHKGVKKEIFITYNYTVLKEVSPNNSVTLEGNSVLVVKAIARIGASVTATLGGKTINLKQGVLKEGDSTEKDTEYTLFEGDFTLPSGTSYNKDLGRIKYTATKNGVSNVGYSGNIYIKKEPAAVSSKKPITSSKKPSSSSKPASSSSKPSSSSKKPSSSNSTSSSPENENGGVEPGNKLIAEVTISYAETFDGDTTDDYSRPTNSYLPYGTIDYCGETKIYDSDSGSYYRKLGCNKRVYTSSIKTYKGTLNKKNPLSVRSINNSGQYTTITLDQSYTFPHNIDLKPQSYTNPKTQDYTISSVTYSYVEVKLSYASKVTGNFDFSDNPLFKSATVTKKTTCYLLKLYLREKGKFYGYTSYYNDNNDLVLKFLNPKKTSGNSLSGIKIMLDPGHGGSDPGAVAYNNQGKKITEAERCLALAKAVRTKLKDLGATVSMTRTTDASLTPSTRLSKIRNSGAHLTVSIHRNSASNANANGFKAYHFNAYQKKPAQYIFNATKNNSDVKKALSTYATSAWSGIGWHWFGYSRVSNMPVVLLECGFMSNAKDLQAMIKDSFTDACADAIVDGIVDHFNNQ